MREDDIELDFLSYLRASEEQERLAAERAASGGRPRANSGVPSSAGNMSRSRADAHTRTPYYGGAAPIRYDDSVELGDGEDIDSGSSVYSDKDNRGPSVVR